MVCGELIVTKQVGFQAIFLFFNGTAVFLTRFGILWQLSLKYSEEVSEAGKFTGITEPGSRQLPVSSRSDQEEISSLRHLAGIGIKGWLYFGN
jgi:hypothetical protein